jgi:multicomponent Na+:H+ antiporter subunit E
MLLGSILLALAWAALQGEITLVNLVVGYIVGYAILALLAKGGVVPSTLASRTAHASGLAAFFAWELLVANLRVAADRRRAAGQPDRAGGRGDSAGHHE